ncbi:zinc ABC transporter substrate-binding protein [Laspinema sp. A4]|uniref:metal ABC transporter solute-binding protein, Zn/Mn family n=1 Tax=Laspinema sp. D2d TaxID=2953686 RepID=UPI0021BB7F74|nr:zinc ABC transporter substrate-binding protein [Laspinema sp. D2d]MCT7985425.1 zinc ABC transporter substrate-binding protein [Laspinema sp. D2d]
MKTSIHRRAIADYPGKQSLLKLATGLILGFCLSSCTNPGVNQAGESSGSQPQVVSTSTIIADLAESIATEEIQLSSILTPGVDPHIYEPVPADSIALENADLILYNGYNLEPELIKLMNAAGVNARKVAVGEVALPLLMEKQAATTADPHVWGDVTNAIAMVNAIRDALSELSPENAAAIAENAANYTATLEELHRWIQGQIATIPPENRRLVTTHDAFQYYAQSYGLKIIGTLIGISTEEQPSAQTVTRLVEDIKRAQVPAIFAETTINPQLIRTVAAEAGVKLAPQELYSDSIGVAGSESDSYIKMMVSNTRAVVEALGGTYTPFVEAQK